MLFLYPSRHVSLVDGQVMPEHVYVNEGGSSLERAFRGYRFSLIVDDEMTTISQALIHSIAWATW